MLNRLMAGSRRLSGEQLISKLNLHYVVPPVPDTPVEVLVDVLRKAQEVAVASGNVSELLASHLQKAVDIASGLDDYLEKMTTKESEPLAELFKYGFFFFFLA